MKRLALTGITALVLGMPAWADIVNVRVNGELVQFEGTQPREVNGRIMIPLRGVLEKMGARVDWIATDDTVIATRNGTEISLPIGSSTATVNGRSVTLDVPAMTIAGHTMVPLRFVSEALGANVVWLTDTQTVMIDTGNAPTARAYRRPRFDNSRADAARIILPAGTVVACRLDDSLGSRDSAPGDRFTATVESGRDDGGLPAGTKFEGVVREAYPSANGKPGVLDVDFQRIAFPDGDSRDINASLTSLNNKNVTRSSAGMLVERVRPGNERMKWVGIGAGAGLLISTLTKGNILVDTLLGGGAGYLFNEVQRHGANNVSLRPGTEMGVRIDQRLAFAPNQG